MQFWDWFSQATDWLANLTTAKVLLGVGIMMLLLGITRLTSSGRDRSGEWLSENLQVVLSVVVVVFLIIRPFLFQAFYIPSSSMEPTLMGPPDGDLNGSSRVGGASPLRPTSPMATGRASGDRLLVNKLIYRVSEPRRGDIAVFRAPVEASQDQKEFIKRVVGLPGETVEVVGREMSVDGRRVVDLSGDSSILNVDPDGDPVKVRNNRADLETFGSTLTVMAVPDVDDVSATPSLVKADGKVVLRDRQGRIQWTPGLSNVGAEAGVQGKTFTIDGEPRVIVAQGKRLAYRDTHVEINGEPLPEPYIKEPPEATMAPRKLAPGEYFMMGDNRNNSNDSRSWGPLKRERMIGRAEILFWPFNRLHIFHWWLIIAVGVLLVLYNLLQRAVSR